MATTLEFINILPYSAAFGLIAYALTKDKGKATGVAVGTMMVANAANFLELQF